MIIHIIIICSVLLKTDIILFIEYKHLLVNYIFYIVNRR